MRRLLSDIYQRLVFEQLVVMPINFCGGDCHRAVEKNRERLHQPAAKHLAQQQHQQLRRADRNRRHENFSAGADRVYHDAGEFRHGFVQRLVFAVAVGGFQHRQVRLP